MYYTGTFYNFICRWYMYMCIMILVIYFLSQQLCNGDHMNGDNMSWMISDGDIYVTHFVTHSSIHTKLQHNNWNGV